MAAPVDERRLARLRYNCRRGMKELDIMLESFIQQQSVELLAGGWPQLETLLASEDDQLWSWLQGRSQHPDPQLQTIISAINDSASGIR